MTVRAAAAASIVMLAMAIGVPRASGQGPGGDYFPNVTLTTQDGKPVRFYDDLIKGKIVAINLIYTSCQFACPLETARLAQVQKVLGDRVGRDVFFYSISIDPEHDTPEVLKAYAKRFNAGPGWLFLTGSKADIDGISRKLGLYSDPKATRDGHTPYLLIGNESTGQWLRNSAVDNAQITAKRIGDWLSSWQHAPKEPLRSYAEAPVIKLEHGQYMFSTHCAACHTIGGGDRLGPDLHAVTTRRDPRWLTRFIGEPDKVMAEGDPIALELKARFKEVRMPNLDLTGEDVMQLLDYIEAQSRKVQPAAGVALPAPANAPVPARAGTARVPAGILASYLRIQVALNGDTLRGVPDAARTLAVEAAKLGAAGDALKASAGKFQPTSDLAAARAALAPLTAAIVGYARAAGLSYGPDVHLAYCPMAAKQWLQAGTRIRNPYYGKAMSDCGRIVKGAQ